jgi:hypothetical protein
MPISVKKSGAHARTRLHDLVWYVVISIVIILPVVVAAIYDLPEEQIMKWFGFVVFTMYLFGQFILKSRDQWKTRAFWVITGSCFLIHTTVITRALLTGWQVTGFTWLMLILAEAAFLILLRRLMIWKVNE